MRKQNGREDGIQIITEHSLILTLQVQLSLQMLKMKFVSIISDYNFSLTLQFASQKKRLEILLLKIMFSIEHRLCIL